MYLLLYYLYCLCKSVQRSLVLRLLFFSKADAKVRTLFHIFQIFSEVFFIFFLRLALMAMDYTDIRVINSILLLLLSFYLFYVLTQEKTFIGIRNVIT